MIEASSSSSEYKPIDAGAYIARCFSMVQIGTIEQEYMGETKELNKVRITWELPNEKKVFKEGEPEKVLTVSKEFTLSLHEKANLRKFLESWRGRGFTDEEAKKFNISKLLGVPCFLSIIHKISRQGKVYADISSISTLPKGMVCPEQVYHNFEFSFTPFDQDKFDSLPDWLKDKIRTSKEYRTLHEPGDHQVSDSDSLPSADDDLPFN